jgi:hypothetical protein
VEKVLFTHYSQRNGAGRGAHHKSLIKKTHGFIRNSSSSVTPFSTIYLHMLLALAIVFLAIWLGAMGSGYKLPFLVHAPLVVAIGLGIGHFLLPKRRPSPCDDDPAHQRKGSSLLRRR